MTERTTVRLPDDLIRRAKQKAAAEGRTLTALIEDGLRQILNDRGAKKAKRVMPRVDTSTGGVNPGIDLNDMASLQEMEDLDSAGRFR